MADISQESIPNGFLHVESLVQTIYCFYKKSYFIFSFVFYFFRVSSRTKSFYFSCYLLDREYSFFCKYKYTSNNEKD